MKYVDYLMFKDVVTFYYLLKITDTMEIHCSGSVVGKSKKAGSANAAHTISDISLWKCCNSTDVAEVDHTIKDGRRRVMLCWSTPG